MVFLRLQLSLKCPSSLLCRDFMASPQNEARWILRRRANSKTSRALIALGFQDGRRAHVLCCVITCLTLWRAYCALTHFPGRWFMVCQTWIWSVHSSGWRSNDRLVRVVPSDKRKAKKSALEARERQRTLTRVLIYFFPLFSVIWQRSVLISGTAVMRYPYQCGWLESCCLALSI